MAKLGEVKVVVRMSYADYADLQKFKGPSDGVKLLMLFRLAAKSLERSEKAAQANVAKAEAEYDRQRLPWFKRIFRKSKSSAAQSPGALGKS